MLKWAQRVSPPNDATPDMTAYHMCNMIAANVAEGYRVTEQPRGDIPYVTRAGRGQRGARRAERGNRRGRGVRGRGPDL